MANAIHLSQLLFDRQVESEERLRLVESRPHAPIPRARESGIVLKAKSRVSAARERCEASFVALDERLRMIVLRNPHATSFRGLRDALAKLHACAFVAPLRRWLENGSPIVAYLTAVQSWCADVIHLAERGGAPRWRTSERALAADSARYVRLGVEPAFHALRELCTNAKLRAALWPSLPQRRIPGPPPLFSMRASRGSSTPPKGAEEILQDVWVRAESLEDEVIALNWELSPDLDRAR